MNNITRPPFGATKKGLNMTSLDVICADEDDFFYYEGSEEQVPEGEPVGIEFDEGNEMVIKLFSNIYFSQEEY